MKSIILVGLALATVAVAAPVAEAPKIIHSDFQQQPEGGYTYVYETEDGTYRHEQGYFKELYDEENKPYKVLVVNGSYTYRRVDGYPETISYVADETGFHAEGDSVPKIPYARR